MTKESLLTIVVIALAVLNVAILGGLFLNKKKGDQRPGPRMHNEMEKNKRVQMHFDFDDDQMQAFIKSKRNLGKQMRQLHKNIEEKSKEYYRFNNAVDSTRRIELLQEITDIQKDIFKANTRHFEDIKAVCNEGQISRLDQFIDQLLMDHPPMRKGRKGPGR